MAEVSGRTLMMAVQAVAAHIKTLEAEVRSAEDDDVVGELNELLLSYDQAAQELRVAYKSAQAATSNLPAYEDLVSDDS